MNRELFEIVENEINSFFSLMGLPLKKKEIVFVDVLWELKRSLRSDLLNKPLSVGLFCKVREITREVLKRKLKSVHHKMS